MIKKIIFTGAVLGSLLSCNSNRQTASVNIGADSNTSSASTTSKDGFTSLFDGKTMAGWHTYGSDQAGNKGKIADGALYLDTTNTPGVKLKGGDLVTDKEYENFHLKLDWKIAPKGNSGIIFFVHEDTAKYKATYNTGPEMQVLDNDSHPDGKIIKHRTGDLYDLISSSKETVKPVGEWNVAEIIAKDGKLDFILNGTNVVSTTMWDDAWKQKVANSKFKSMAGFSTYKKGRIALQDHGNMVWYRNIKIKEL